MYYTEASFILEKIKQKELMGNNVNTDSKYKITNLVSHLFNM